MRPVTGFLVVASVGLGLFGASALALPMRWYTDVPGVVETGPANLHFIRDIGIAYLTVALASALAAARARWRWPLMLLVAFNTILHAALHAAEMLAGGHADGANPFEAALVYGSAVLSGAVLWLVRPRRDDTSPKEERHAASRA